MAARAGMTNLITELRSYTAAGTADYSVAGVSYWTDDQLQNELDKTQVTHRLLALDYRAEWESSVAIYKDYFWPDTLPWIEREPTGEFAVKDSNGAPIGTAQYSVTYEARRVTFTNNTGGSYLYLDCRSYDLYAAAANVWQQKAAYWGGFADWSSDNHRVNASQRHKHALEQAAEYRRKATSGPSAGIQVSVLYRSDET